MNDKFTIAKHIKEFIMLFSEYLINYPKIYHELRDKIASDSYELLELVYIANYTEINERKNLQVKALVKVNISDFYIEQSFKKKIISERQSIKLSNKLLGINKMLFKWIKDES